MKKKLNMSRIINLLVNYIEMIVSAVLIIAVVVMLIECILDLVILSTDSSSFDFDYFLSKLINLIIGLEFTRMLCKHTPGTILEVVLFATARQMIVNHTNAADTLIGVASICILFIIRKFLLSEKEQKQPFILDFKNTIKNKFQDPGKPEDELSKIPTPD